jgi:hypothetical protein
MVLCSVPIVTNINVFKKGSMMICCCGARRLIEQYLRRNVLPVC